MAWNRFGSGKLVARKAASAALSSAGSPPK